MSEPSDASRNIGKSAGNRGKGRRKGSVNKTTGLAKDAIAAAAVGLGGTKRLIAWAKSAPENERVFWGQIYTKLLPLQVTGEGGGPLTVNIVKFCE